MSCDAGTPERKPLGAQASDGSGSGALAFAALLLVALCATPGSSAGEVDTACAARTMRVTFYTCGEGYPHCLTKRGNLPLPFRTVAVGDRKLLGRWLYIEDLGGWVHATDTAAALKRDSIDVFIGETRMAPHARRLGVHYWTMHPCGPDAEPASRVAAGASGEAPRAGGQP